MSNFRILSEEWDYSQKKTVFTYKKQKEIILEILKKYPTAKSLYTKLISTKNPEAIKLAGTIDPDWDRDLYIIYLKMNIIRYSSIGKILLSYTITMLLGIGTALIYKHYIDQPIKDKYSEVISNTRNEFNKLTDNGKKPILQGSEEDQKVRDIITRNTPILDELDIQKKNNNRKAFLVGAGTKLSLTPLSHYLMNKWDNDRI